MRNSRTRQYVLVHGITFMQPSLEIRRQIIKCCILLIHNRYFVSSFIQVISKLRTDSTTTNYYCFHISSIFLVYLVRDFHNDNVLMENEYSAQGIRSSRVQPLTP